MDPYWQTLTCIMRQGLDTKQAYSILFTSIMSRQSSELMIEIYLKAIWSTRHRGCFNRLWERLGFVKAGKIPRAGRLRTMDGTGEEYVDAWVFYKEFDSVA